MDVSDLMRRLTKEELRKFDGTPLFPERCAYTARYELSTAEASLYTAVTDYVRQEMNRADRIEGDGKRRANVGFALQTLQRRLASSPEASYQSLRRRRERLERRLEEEGLRRRGQDAGLSPDLDIVLRAPDDDALGEAPEAEIEQAEDALVDQATAARTIAELQAEITSLRALETEAQALRRSGQDAKWRELDSILDDPLMTGEGNTRRKLIVFTEPRDTLGYLATRIRNRLGRDEAVVVIHGGVGREDRRKAIELFMNDPAVLVLVANDAAGEGVNLQRAHLMVNYDLPWNPNRLEQRFGRIHRIGQTEVCHLWNLVAAGTREGDVYARLLEKLDAAREALGGRVYDVLGRLFEGEALRDLLLQAVRYGDDPEVRARLLQAVEGAVDRDRLLDLIAERALVHNALSQERVAEIRREMERAAARRL
ncbi:MAG: helicase-related protein, partial [Acetobacteraceae bacterium]